THLFVIMQAAKRLLGVTLDASIVLRVVTLFYGALTIWLIAAIARGWQLSRGVALLAAAFLAVAPLHILNSNFGTADVAANFYFYLTLWLGWWYVKRRTPILFVLFAASLGAVIATKLYLSLVVPVLLVVWLSDSRFEKALTGALVTAGSFSIYSFFNYSPFDLSALRYMLSVDNLRVISGYSPGEQALHYSWETITALGIAVWIFFAIGAVLWLAKQIPAIAARLREAGWRGLARDWLHAPGIVFWSGLIVHAFLLLSAQLHAPRNMLVYIPIFCLVAAIGFAETVRHLRMPKAAVAVILVVLFAYQIYNAVGLERLYREDPRNALAQWIADTEDAKNQAGTFSFYSRVRGSHLIKGEDSAESRINTRYFITCDLEFARYFKGTEASKIHHAFGGQKRLDLYHGMFADRLPFKIVLDLKQAPLSFEQWLIDKGYLRGLETFTPRRCVVFERTGAPVRDKSSG
ncbi:MAG: hypothetical protein MJE12_27650, partial [Alphaproteobacteria bacterium]|nr:hypothetical protein [Alphaproteobacteria bacterium]